MKTAEGSLEELQVMVRKEACRLAVAAAQVQAPPPGITRSQLRQAWLAPATWTWDRHGSLVMVRV